MAPLAGVLAGAIAVALVMLVTMAGALLAADWWADQRSRQAWAEVASALAEWNPIDCGEAEDIETRYWPSSVDVALRGVFHSHRFLPPQSAVMELPVANSAIQTAPTQGFPSWATCRTAQAGCVDGENDAGALFRDDLVDRATLGWARSAKGSALVAGRQQAGGYRAVDGNRIRLAVNAGPNWLASDWALATQRHAAEVVVLASSRDAQNMRPEEAATAINCATGTEPPNCRGPPALEQRRLARRVATKAGRAAAAAKASGGDLVVLDNLGQPVPMCPAEVDVIETYLGKLLEELLVSSKAGSDADRT
jgi:hypothetical protein